MLNVEGLSGGYGRVPVLRDVSFSVKEHEFMALIGPNGAGKTTALRMISGLLRPTNGEIRFEGDAISGLAVEEISRRGVSLVPEGRRLFAQMTVLENLQMGAYVPRGRGQMAATLEWVLDLFPNLADRQGQRAETLSGGEQQMVAIGRALMAYPRLLMLDEPSLGLAPILVEEIFAKLTSLRDRGITVLLVEQNVQHALSVADRAYLLEMGQVVLEGSSADLLEDDRVRRAYLGLQ